MIDTPYESYCALVAHLWGEHGRLYNENAVDYLARLKIKPWDAFMRGVPAQEYVNSLWKFCGKPEGSHICGGWYKDHHKHIKDHDFQVSTFGADDVMPGDW